MKPAPFRGATDHTIDPKGRIILPVRFRQVLERLGSDGVVISRMDGALFAYSYDRWSQIEEDINSRAQKSETMRRIRRIFIGTAAECLWDTQGRILIPKDLRDYAALEGDIKLVGVTDHFEIWNRERWMAQNAMIEEQDMMKEEVRNEIAQLGL